MLDTFFADDPYFKVTFLVAETDFLKKEHLDLKAILCNAIKNATAQFSCRFL